MSQSGETWLCTCLIAFGLHGKLIMGRSEGEEEERAAGLPLPLSEGISLPIGPLFCLICSWSRRIGAGLLSKKSL